MHYPTPPSTPSKSRSPLVDPNTLKVLPHKVRISVNAPLRQFRHGALNLVGL